MRAVLRLALLTLLTLLLCAEASHAQVDLAKALVGRWEGEQEFLVERSEDPKTGWPTGDTGRPRAWEE